MSAMNLLSENKEKLIAELMKNQNILKCLYYKDNTKDIFEQPDITKKKDLITLQQNNIFRYKKIPTEGMSQQEIWIGMEYGIVDYSYDINNGWRKTSNSYWISPNMFLYIYSNVDLDDNYINGSRIETIECEIRKSFHNKFSLESFGKVFLTISEPIPHLPLEFIGRKLTLRFVEEGLTNQC